MMNSASITEDEISKNKTEPTYKNRWMMNSASITQDGISDNETEPTYKNR
jgi:hypothetical protein